MYQMGNKIIDSINMYAFLLLSGYSGDSEISENDLDLLKKANEQITIFIKRNEKKGA